MEDNTCGPKLWGIGDCWWPLPRLEKMRGVPRTVDRSCPTSFVTWLSLNAVGWGEDWNPWCREKGRSASRQISCSYFSRYIFSFLSYFALILCVSLKDFLMLARGRHSQYSVSCEWHLVIRACLCDVQIQHLVIKYWQFMSTLKL